MSSSTPMLSGRFALAGLIATVPSILLVEVVEHLVSHPPQILFDQVPPLSVAVALWWISRREGLARRSRWIPDLLALAVTASASWYLAQKVYMQIHGPEREYVAGAIGALILALPLPWIWSASRRAGILLLAAILAGILGVALAIAIRAPFHAALTDHDRWLYVLMCIWQATVFAALAVARKLL
jgi:hypothetical protein